MKEASGILLEGRQVASLVQCCHCAAHFEIVRGSGRIRGFCLQCNKVTCGKESCNICLPIEVRLDFQEGRKIAAKYLDGALMLQRKGLL